MSKNLCLPVLGAIVLSTAGCRDGGNLYAGPQIIDVEGDNGAKVAVDIGEYWKALPSPPADVDLRGPRDYAWFQGSRGELIAVKLTPLPEGFVADREGIIQNISNNSGNLWSGFSAEKHGESYVVWHEDLRNRSITGHRPLKEFLFYVTGFKFGSPEKIVVDEVLRIMESARLVE